MMFRSKKLLQSVREMACQACGKYGASVPAHANWQQYGKGIGLKAHDIFVAALCPLCHDLVDGRHGALSNAERHDLWHAAWIKTLTWWVVHGTLK